MSHALFPAFPFPGRRSTLIAGSWDEPRTSDEVRHHGLLLASNTSKLEVTLLMHCNPFIQHTYPSSSAWKLHRRRTSPACEETCGDWRQMRPVRTKGGLMIHRSVESTWHGTALLPRRKTKRRSHCRVTASHTWVHVCGWRNIDEALRSWR